MFLIFTKSNCISSKKIIEYVKDRNQTFKEVNTSLECLTDDHIKLLSSIKGKSFLNFLRPKAKYFNENNLDYNSLSENILMNIMKFNLKDVGSFPIILFLSYSGRVKNCMIGINKEILDSWIENESIKDVFIDCNKPYGTEQCCWLDKKEQILGEIKSKYSNNKNTKEDLLNIDNSNLFNLRKINDRLVGKESTIDRFENLKKESENKSKDEDIFKKYIDARNKIIDNDNQHKNSFDFFEIENKNKSFLEQLENEKNDFLSKKNNHDPEITFDDFNEENNKNVDINVIDTDKNNYNENDYLENFDFDDNLKSNLDHDTLSDELDSINENIENISEDNHDVTETPQNNFEDDEFIEINYDDLEDNINDNNTELDNNFIDNDHIENNDDFIDITQENIENNQREVDYSLSNDETIVEESLISDYLDDEYIDNNNYSNTNQSNIINDNETKEFKNNNDEFIAPINIQDNNLTNEELKNDENVVLHDQILEDEHTENTQSKDHSNDSQLQKEELSVSTENNLNNSDNNDQDDFITVDLSEDPFLKNISQNNNEETNNDFVEIKNDGEGLKIFEIDEQTQHIKNDSNKNDKNYLSTSNKVIDEYDEWINKYELTESEIAHQKAIENEK